MSAWVNPPLYDQANVAITGGAANFDAGTAGAPSLTLGGDLTTGWYRSSANQWTWTQGGNPTYQFIGSTIKISSGASLSWANNTNAVSGTGDLTLSRQAAGVLCLNSGTATPAGGSASMALAFGSTTGFGIYIGSGAPTVSAAKGSLYLRSDGSSTSTRLYVNTDGATTWTNVTTAA